MEHFIHGWSSAVDNEYTDVLHTEYNPLHYDPDYCILHFSHGYLAIANQNMRVKRPRFNLHVTQTESAFAQGTSSRWTNADLDPVPNHLQNWGVLSFVGMPPAHSTSTGTGTDQRMARLIQLGLAI